MIIIKKLKLFSILIIIIIIGSSCSSIFESDNISDVNTNSKISNISNENDSKDNSEEVSINKNNDINNENDFEENSKLEFILPKEKQDYFKEVDITFINSYQDDFTYPIDAISLEEPLTISVMLPTHVNPTNATVDTIGGYEVKGINPTTGDDSIIIISGLYKISDLMPFNENLSPFFRFFNKGDFDSVANYGTMRIKTLNNLEGILYLLDNDNCYVYLKVNDYILRMTISDNNERSSTLLYIMQSVKIK